MTPFGVKLRQLRAERGIALKDMAEALGVSAAYLSAMRVWHRDESSDLARTMAALDARLRRIERWLAERSSERCGGQFRGYFRDRGVGRGAERETNILFNQILTRY